ncbi:MAG: hypothetical protein AAFY76_25265, partial [Cyanobacteria bacterium J06649_11]
MRIFFGFTLQERSTFLCHDNIVAVRWKDKRDVYVLSSIHGNQIEEVQRRGEEEPVQKPRMITQYNTFMGGVDKCDQKIANYNNLRRTKKWWKKLFFRFVEISVVNAMTVYVTLFPEVLPNRSRHRSFRTVLFHVLVQPLLDHKAENYVDPRQSNLQDTRLKGK